MVDAVSDQPLIMNVRKAAGYVQVPRELLLDAGSIEPTPAERAEAERKAAEWRKVKAQRDVIRDAARRRLAAIDDPLSRVILDLHHRSEGGWCEGDDLDGADFDPPEWPCRTVRAVAEHHGIELGDW